MPSPTTPWTPSGTDPKDIELDDVRAENNAAFLELYNLLQALGDLAALNDVNTPQVRDNAINNAKLADMVSGTLKGRSSDGTGDPENLTAAQVRSLLNVTNGATANDTDANLRARASHTGTQAISTVSGLQTALDGKATTAQGGKADTAVQPGDLSDVATSGSAEDLTEGATQKLLTPAERSKLSGIATAATANDTDANLKARANHTGTQAISTVSGLQTALDGKATTAQGGKADTAVQPDDLGTAADEDVEAFAASGQFVGQASLSRPGEAIDLFSATLTGSPENKVSLSGVAAVSVVNSATLGRSVQISGAEVIVARKQPVAIEPGRIYRPVFDVIRATDPADPAGHAIRLAVSWQGGTFAEVDTDVLAEETRSEATGRWRPTLETWSLDAEGADNVIPVGSKYALPYVHAFGTDGAVRLGHVEFRDVTEEVLGAARGVEIDALDAGLDLVSLSASRVRRRAGDAPYLYSHTLAAGSHTSRTEIDADEVVTVTNGTAILWDIAVSDKLVMREAIALSDTPVRINLRSSSSVVAPVVDAVYYVKVAWMDGARAILSTSTYRTVPDAGDAGILLEDFTLAASGTASSLTPPSDAKYALVYVEVDGTSGNFIASEFTATSEQVDPDIGLIKAYLRGIDTPPSAILLSRREVSSQAGIGDTVGVLSLLDPDQAGDAVFELTDDASGKFGVSGSVLQVAGALADGQYSITVRATDFLGNVISQDLAITAVDSLFHPNDISPDYVMDLSDGGTLWQDTAGTVAATVGDTVARVDDAAGGSVRFEQGVTASEPDLLSDVDGRLYLHNAAGATNQRMRSTAAIVSGQDYYLGLAVMIEGDMPTQPFLQVDTAVGFGTTGGLWLEGNVNFATNGTRSAVAGRLIAGINGATDGLSAADSGLGFGSPQNSFIEAGKAFTVELVSVASGLCEMWVNGVLVDRYTSTVAATTELSWILANPLDADPSPCRIYGMVSKNSAVTASERANLGRWLADACGATRANVDVIENVWAVRAAAVDVATGQLLAGKNSDTLAAPASMAKMMMAYVVFKYLGLHGTLSDTMTVSAADGHLAYSAGTQIQDGDVISVGDLLYGAGMQSDNGAAYTLGTYFGGLILENDGQETYTGTEAVQHFISVMNSVGTDLGFADGTIFTTPVGGANARITARDMAYLAGKLFVDYPAASPMFSTETYAASVTGANARTVTFTTTNDLLQRGDPNIDEAKTGTLFGVENFASVWEDGSGNRVAICTMDSVIDRYRFGDHVTIYSQVAQDHTWINGVPVPVR